MQLAACLSFAACAIRLIPSAMSKAGREQFSSTIPLHVAQILNGIAGPVLIAAPSRLSAVWFPPGQRATVTAIANSSLFGAAIAFYLGTSTFVCVFGVKLKLEGVRVRASIGFAAALARLICAAVGRKESSACFHIVTC
jgi:hypothetical protein